MVVGFTIAYAIKKGKKQISSNNKKKSRNSSKIQNSKK
jgi:hypothetical protein